MATPLSNTTLAGTLILMMGWGSTAYAQPAATPPPPPAVKKLAPFAVGAFGKERRTLEVDADEVDGGFDPALGTSIGSFCDPLFGIRGGVEFLVKPIFVIAPSVGVAFNLDEGDRTSLFTEVEFNRLFANGGFIGAGVGLWDFNHGDNVTGDLLVHFGVPITKYADNKARLLFVVEGRLFFDEFDDASNNYQAWAGLRYLFR